MCADIPEGVRDCVAVCLRRVSQFNLDRYY